MWYQWLIFLAILIGVPAGAFCFIRFREGQISFSEIKKKNARITGVKVTLFHWFFDLFYMSFIIDNIICKFVFGSISLILIIIDLVNAFLSSYHKDLVIKISIIEDFIIGAGLTIYLIYIIPNSLLQSIFLTIIAAIYGGLITLIGVAWTIKKSDRDRKRDEVLKNKPYFVVEPLILNEKSIINKNICNETEERVRTTVYDVYATIKNSNCSVVNLSKVYHDGKWVDFEANNVLIPSGSIVLKFSISDENNIILEVFDTLKNPYYYDITILKYFHEENMPVVYGYFAVYTIKSIREISIQEVDERIKESSEKSKS